MASNPAILDQQLPPVLALTCTDCGLTYSPSAEDFATGAAGCPNPDCGGWTLLAALTESATAGGAPVGGQRRAVPGEVCTCGRRAVLVFLGGRHGDTGYCGAPDGGDRSGPCPFCGGDRHEGRCPRYILTGGAS